MSSTCERKRARHYGQSCEYHRAILPGRSAGVDALPLAGAGQYSFTAFALFMGIAMSITAFPVLARILEDRRMSQTHLGTWRSRAPRSMT